MRIGPLGIWELLIILVVVLLIFGPRRLPEMAKGIGQSVREFRKGIRDMKDDFEAGTKDDETKPPAKQASGRNANEGEEDPGSRAKVEPVEDKPLESSSV